MIKVYGYQGCSTCRDAIKWLNEHKIAHEEIAIRETPPSESELAAMVKANGGKLTPVCNTSGMDYRDLGMKDKFAAMSQEEALKVLSGNGKLVKRPFVIDEAKGIFLTGFKAAKWEEALLK